MELNFHKFIEEDLIEQILILEIPFLKRYYNNFIIYERYKIKKLIKSR